MDSKTNIATTDSIRAQDASDRRRDFLRVAAGAALSGFPAIVRAQGQKRFLRPLVAGLNSKPGDPSYNSIANISKILREKYDVQMEVQLAASRQSSPASVSLPAASTSRRPKRSAGSSRSTAST